MIKTAELKNLSLANLTVGGGDPVLLIETSAANGFGAVGLVLRAATPKPLHTEIVGRPEVIRTIRSACVANGVRVFDIEAFVLRQGVEVESYRAALETGATLGATHISAIGAETGAGDRSLAREARVDLFGRLCDEAAQYGLVVGVEFMLYRDVATLGQSVSLIEATGRRNAGVILDILHFHRSGGRLQEITGAPPSRIAYAQLCDVAPVAPAFGDLAKEARSARLPLGRGVAPLEAVLDILPEHTPLVIETPIFAEAEYSTEEKVRSAALSTAAFFKARGARLCA
jgi:sugar phosphate isomerase/epimerase